MKPAPSNAYLVCATPRSGSTLLCEMLRATGRAGQPLEHFEILRHSSVPRQPREYFTDQPPPGVLERLAPLQPGTPSSEPAEAWWARILTEGSTENGVWGGKIMWGHVEDFVARVRDLPGLADADLSRALHELLNDPQLIFATRQDKVAQAVSLWRALQTQAWRNEDAADHSTPVYDFSAIDYLLEQLQAHEDAWTRWFERTGREPIHVSYEQLEQAVCETTAEVLGALGLPTADIPEPPLSRQADEVSSAWIERFNRERTRAA